MSVQMVVTVNKAWLCWSLWLFFAMVVTVTTAAETTTSSPPTFAKRLTLESMSQSVRNMDYAVRGKVVIAGELEGNIEEASRVELLPTGVVIGDIKAGSLTVAAGARMRGQADFGDTDARTSKPGKLHSNGHLAESSISS